MGGNKHLIVVVSSEGGCKHSALGVAASCRCFRMGILEPAINVVGPNMLRGPNREQ